ncbi:MAG: 23S rRNA (pseudouridine(1915)-N(3))-methyltransferase RlmH [Clostridia bacterium]|nr:23S rRNA (pseudouridine(1915)-N(3))-methyltransferase RlmH [Clostridia bacterium]
MKIKIIALGKLKEGYLRQASEEYLKRLSAFAKVEIAELEPVRLSDNPQNAEIEKALDTEATQILKRLDPNDYVVAMCIEGSQMSSEELSEKLSSLINLGSGSFVFIIGSSFGLSKEVKKRADLKISFSKMTFPHQLFRIMLLEQIYRAFKIKQGSNYHK